MCVALYFSAVSLQAEKKYNTNSLVKDAVSSCIAECEQGTVNVLC